MGKGEKVQGEGNYDAAEHYREKTEEFIDSGKVERQQEDLANIGDSEEKDLEKAEEAGKERAKEEDPLVKERK